MPVRTAIKPARIFTDLLCGSKNTSKIQLTSKRGAAGAFPVRRKPVLALALGLFHLVVDGLGDLRQPATVADPAYHIGHALIGPEQRALGALRRVAHLGCLGF